MKTRLWLSREKSSPIARGSFLRSQHTNYYRTCLGFTFHTQRDFFLPTGHFFFILWFLLLSLFGRITMEPESEVNPVNIAQLDEHDSYDEISLEDDALEGE